MKNAAVALSVFCSVLTLLLVLFGGYVGFNASSNSPWCTHEPNDAFAQTYVGVTIFSITGFVLLVLSILFAFLALGGEKEKSAVRMGAIICLAIGIIGLPLFGLFSFLAAFACAG